MPTYASSQDWLHHSSLLLQARPSTTIITTHYSISPAKSKPNQPADPDTLPDAPTITDKPPRGRLVLKTYDPASGACLKYKTTKAAEVSRLVQMLGTLSRHMAALPEREEPVPAAVEVGAEGESGAATPVPPAQGQTQGGGSGGKGKKKKAKR